jgi:hypothetical protein
MNLMLCQCGCGHETRVVRGESLRYINHHHPGNLGNINGRWKGDNASRSAIHKWLSKIKPLTGICEECGVTGKRTEYSNVDHTYRRVVEDYRELCSRCHRYYDYLELGTPNPALDKVFAN